MKTWTKLLGIVFITFLTFGCDKEDDELVKEGPFNISELAGTWVATRANFSGSNTSIDVVGEGGNVTISIQSSGRFTMTIDAVDRPAYTVSGEMSWEKFEGQFYFAIEWDNYPGDWDTYGATLNDTVFSINGGFDSGEYDFDNDGTFEPCSISFSFTRGSTSSLL